MSYSLSPSEKQEQREKQQMLKMSLVLTAIQIVSALVWIVMTGYEVRIDFTSILERDFWGKLMTLFALFCFLAIFITSVIVGAYIIVSFNRKYVVNASSEQKAIIARMIIVVTIGNALALLITYLLPRPLLHIMYLLQPQLSGMQEVTQLVSLFGGLLSVIAVICCFVSLMLISKKRFSAMDR